MEKKMKKPKSEKEYEEIMEGIDKLSPKVRDVMAKTAVVKKVWECKEEESGSKIKGGKRKEKGNGKSNSE